jgi:hypothetical protein
MPSMRKDCALAPRTVGRGAGPVDKYSITGTKPVIGLGTGEVNALLGKISEVQTGYADDYGDRPTDQIQTLVIQTSKKSSVHILNCIRMLTLRNVARRLFCCTCVIEDI